MDACPVDAIQTNPENGSKDVIASKCVGCKVCTLACPFGTVNYVSATGKVAKCDLCGGDPACTKACPTGAITYIDADGTGIPKMQKWAEKMATAIEAQA